MKRIHEYKRQLLNVLGMIWRYDSIKKMTPKQRKQVRPLCRSPGIRRHRFCALARSNRWRERDASWTACCMPASGFESPQSNTGGFASTMQAYAQGWAAHMMRTSFAW